MHACVCVRVRLSRSVCVCMCVKSECVFDIFFIYVCKCLVLSHFRALSKWTYPHLNPDIDFAALTRTLYA